MEFCTIWLFPGKSCYVRLYMKTTSPSTTAVSAKQMNVGLKTHLYFAYAPTVMVIFITDHDQLDKTTLKVDLSSQKNCPMLDY